MPVYSGSRTLRYIYLVGTVILCIMETAAAWTGAPHRVAVIGAGASGLACARALARRIAEGRSIEATVFEQDQRSGGVWNHVPGDKSRPMYRGLRTNLPKEIMAYREFPWTNVKESYVSHRDVAGYLESYRNHFNLTEFIRFGTRIEQLSMVDSQQSKISPPDEKWPAVELSWTEITYAGTNDEEREQRCHSEMFDAVYVCNGHYAKPSIPHLPGLSEYFKGKTMHSVEYDDPADFAGETVLCIGGRASGADLAREISHVAKEVYVSDSACPAQARDEPPRTLDNMTWLPSTLRIRPDQSIEFEKGYTLEEKVDRIIFCTGYDYEFPFVNEKSNLHLDFPAGERRVRPLYEQLWHAEYPNLAFIGLPHSVLPFPLFEIQAEAATASWFNEQRLPSLEVREAKAQHDASSGGAKEDGRIQDTHYLGSAQWEYCRRLADFSRCLDRDMECYLQTNQDIWDHSGAERKGEFPGSPDIYRQTQYKRNKDRDPAFEVLISGVATQQSSAVGTSKVSVNSLPS